eukprot:s551_g16.t3
MEIGFVHYLRRGCPVWALWDPLGTWQRMATRQKCESQVSPGFAMPFLYHTFVSYRRYIANAGRVIKGHGLDWSLSDHDVPTLPLWTLCITVPRGSR